MSLENNTRPGDADQSVIEMPVIVGRPNNRTPMFTANIEQVIFQPLWDVPAGVALGSGQFDQIAAKANLVRRHESRNH